MKQQFLTLLVVASLVLATAPAPALAANVDTPTAVEYSAQPSYIVHYEDGKLSSLETWANSSNDRELVNTDNDTNTALVSAPAVQIADHYVFGLDRRPLTTQLDERGWVESVRPNYRLQRTTPVTQVPDELDPGISRTQSLYLAGTFGPSNIDTSTVATEANTTPVGESVELMGGDNTSETGEGTLVAVVDTGANVAGTNSAPSTQGRIFGNGTSGSDVRIHNASKNFITDESVNATSGDFDAVADGAGHGTHVASTIAANHSNSSLDGVAPDAELLVLKALADDGSGETQDIADAIRYAADQDADVLSLSLGSPVQSEELADAITYARENGTVVVVAAGNSRFQGQDFLASPSDADGVLAVHATTPDNASEAESAWFAQVGPDPRTSNGVDVAAHGMSIQAATATESGTLTTETLSGTSMATPFVSGTAALVAAANSGLSVEEIETRITEGARAAPNMASAEAGNGLLAIGNAVAGTTPDKEQEDAMTTESESRDDYYNAVSGLSNGILGIVLADDQEVGA
jgi:subtilisin family serine protease